jgi:SAM-dependent methyltransferase
MNEFSRDDILNNPILKKYWYYSVELYPGFFTNGGNFNHIYLTRKILKQVSVENMNCLDIGTVEGLYPILLNRRNAKSVTAYDRWDNTEKIDFLKNIYNVDYKYFTKLKLLDLPNKLIEANLFPFDIVVFSGVLYHMLDPLGGLATVRGLIRNGGILIFETAAVINNSMAMYFNAEGRFYPGTNYFMVSVECLEYMLRFLRFQPLDCIYLLHEKDKKTNLQICRICIACRAVAQPIATSDDKWTNKTIFQEDLDEFLNWAALENNQTQVTYNKISNGSVLREDCDSINIYESVINSEPQKSNKDLIKLKLTDIY